MVVKPVVEHSCEEVLDAVEGIFLAQLQGNADIFRFAAHFADLYNGDSVPDAARKRALPGMERSIRLGGAGTPLVREFAFAEFGARMRMGTYGVRALAADALDVRHRLPLLWQRVCSGEVKVSYARHVAQATRDLSVDGAGLVDAAVAPVADGRLSWGRFCDQVDAAVVAADPEAAAEREAAAARRQFARATRSSDSGMKGFYLRDHGQPHPRRPAPRRVHRHPQRGDHGDHGDGRAGPAARRRWRRR
jgi:hypothetical protein